MAKTSVPPPAKRIAADNVSSVFEARRDLRPAAKLIVKGSGLGIEEADILILLYSVRKLGGTECQSYGGYVNFTDLKKAMVHDPSLFSRRVKRLEKDGLVHVRPSREGDPALHAKAQQVRIEDAGVKVVAPIWKRYCEFSEELLKGFTKAELDNHYRVNREMSRIVRDRLDPAKQLLGL
jgi:DNA-binding MarR family transcriptional regulator